MPMRRNTALRESALLTRRAVQKEPTYKGSPLRLAISYELRCGSPRSMPAVGNALISALTCGRLLPVCAHRRTTVVRDAARTFLSVPPPCAVHPFR
jgi:hypothetical protein